MNKGFNRYFRESYKASFKALKKKDNYFRYLLFLAIEFLSSIFFFIKPITNLASVRLVKSIMYEKRVILSRTIETGDNPKAYWTSVVTIIMKVFLFIGIVLIHIIVAAILVLLGYLVYALIQDSDYSYLTAVFAVPALIALILFIIVSRYLTVDTAYIIDTNPDLGASRVLYASIASLKETGKRTLFLNDLVHSLIYMAITTIATLLAFAVSFLPERAAIPLSILVVLIYVVVCLFMLPVLSLSHKMVKVSLFNDIVIDKYAIKQRISGIRMIEFNKKAQMSIEERLVAVFDNEEDLELEAKLFKRITKPEEKGEIEALELDNARKLIEEKIAAQERVEMIESQIIDDSYDGIPLEEDDLPLEEDELYVEVDSIESDGE